MTSLRSGFSSVFLLLFFSVTRALSSSNIDSFCAVINLVVKISEVDYLTALNQKLVQQSNFAFGESKTQKISQTVSLFPSLSPLFYRDFHFCLLAGRLF